ncbi:Secreted protein with PEP-CTERM sorting signal [Nocardia ninae]
MAKHRQKKSKAPVDYGISLTVAVAIAGALILVRRVWLAR